MRMNNVIPCRHWWKTWKSLRSARNSELTMSVPWWKGSIYCGAIRKAGKKVSKVLRPSFFCSNFFTFCPALRSHFHNKNKNFFLETCDTEKSQTMSILKYSNRNNLNSIWESNNAENALKHFKLIERLRKRALWGNPRNFNPSVFNTECALNYNDEQGFYHST